MACQDDLSTPLTTGLVHNDWPDSVATPVIAGATLSAEGERGMNRRFTLAATKLRPVACKYVHLTLVPGTPHGATTPNAANIN